jgi:hypothetical protein
MNLVPVKACIRLFNHFVSYLPRTTIAWEISQNRIVYAMRQDIMILRSTNNSYKVKQNIELYEG